MSDKTRAERIANLEQCRAEISAVLEKYGCELGWDCDEATDRYGINNLWVDISDGFESIPADQE